MTAVVVLFVVIASVAAVVVASLYCLGAEHDRAVLRDLLWVGQTIHPGQPAALAGSALKERGFQKAWSDVEHETRFLKIYPSLPWGASIDVRLSSAHEQVDAINVMVVDTKSGRPYRP